jgi:hypothetical protein
MPEWEHLCDHTVINVQRFPSVAGWNCFIIMEMVMWCQAPILAQYALVDMLRYIDCTMVSHALHTQAKSVCTVPTEAGDRQLSSSPGAAHRIQQLSTWGLLQAIEEAAQVIQGPPDGLARSEGKFCEACSMRQPGSILEDLLQGIHRPAIVDQTI